MHRLIVRSPSISVERLFKDEVNIVIGPVSFVRSYDPGANPTQTTN